MKQETKDKLRKANLGKRLSETTRKKISNSLKGIKRNKKSYIGKKK